VLAFDSCVKSSGMKCWICVNIKLRHERSGRAMPPALRDMSCEQIELMTCGYGD
jgi:hypothetical protein